ncbi:MAG: membrane lipoprotein lipid attachment site-containing protein, partial [Anaerolineales bacterium]|nr:membrane lipoprotein lipid attachment site-containing protein [Anaerolineales bacterium]
MKKMLFVFLIMLILTACTAVESPPTQTEVPP